LAGHKVIHFKDAFGIKFKCTVQTLLIGLVGFVIMFKDITLLRHLNCYHTKTTTIILKILLFFQVDARYLKDSKIYTWNYGLLWTQVDSTHVQLEAHTL